MAITLQKSNYPGSFTVIDSETGERNRYPAGNYKLISKNDKCTLLAKENFYDQIFFELDPSSIINGDTRQTFSDFEDLDNYIASNFFISAGGGSGSSTTIVTLTANAYTSAGVFDSDDVLIRRLWYNQYLVAGNYPIYWDGKDDHGALVNQSDLKVGVVSHHLGFEWEGSRIGNSSQDKIGDGVHHVYRKLAGLLINNDKAYYMASFSERLPGIFSFDLNNIYQKNDVFPYQTTTPHTTYMCTDGTLMYFAAYDEYHTNVTFIYAINLSDNSKVTFASGVDYQLIEGDIYNVGAKTDSGANQIGQIAINGDLLIVPYPGLDKVAVYNKTTLALVNEITSIVNPRHFTNAGYLWLVSGTNTIKKCFFNPDGTYVPLAVEITGITDPSQVYAGSGTVSVIDYNTQQIKFFDNNTGNLVHTLGQAGGYLADATAADDKFYFKETYAGNFITAIATDPNDNSIWIVDPGNERIQHFDSNYTFIESLYIPGLTYFSQADGQRVFRSFMEYHDNQTDGLSGSNGWQFTRNWGGSISSDYDHFACFTFVKTVSIGEASHTYAGLIYTPTFQAELVELLNDGQIRYSGLRYASCFIDNNNNLITGENAYPITSFSVEGNPVLGTPFVLADTSSLTERTPLSSLHQRHCVTSDGKVGFYNAHGNDKTGPHLGITALSGNSWKALNAYATYETYQGNFPEPDWFDVGNSVNDNAGSMLQAVKNLFFTGYHGENWRQAQTNEYNVYHSSGLALAQFGVTKAQVSGPCPAKSAGNALSPQWVLVSEDVAYLYHGDEAAFGGLHRWKISGLNAVNWQSSPLVKVSQPADGIIDLLAGLIFGQPLQRGLYGYSGDPDTNLPGNLFRTTVGLNSPDTAHPDLDIVYANANLEPKNISRVLEPAPTPFLPWSIKGSVSYQGTDFYGGEQQIEILDTDNKIIARLAAARETDGSLSIRGNDKLLLNGPEEYVRTLLNFNKDFRIAREGNQITFSYDYNSQTTDALVDPDANLNQPASLRYHFLTTDGNGGRADGSMWLKLNGSHFSEQDRKLF